MKNAIILSALLFGTTSVHADVKPEPIKASHIFKLTPPAIKKVTPNGAKILETASFPIGPRESDVWVHLYADVPSLFLPSDVVGASPDSGSYMGDEEVKKMGFVNGKLPLLTSGRLDLFVRRGTRFIRIQTLKFKRPEEDQDLSPGDRLISHELNPFALGDVYWLDMKKNKPIITLYVPDYQGGDFLGGGLFVLFIFDKGLMQPPIRQEFRYWRNDWGTKTTEFVSFDKVGNVRLIDRFQDGDYQPDYNRSTIQYFVWNGSKFAPQK